MRPYHESPSNQQPERNTRILKVGERVRTNFHINNTMNWNFGTIIKKLGHLHYIVELDNGRVVKRNVNQLQRISVSPQSVITTTNLQPPFFQLTYQYHIRMKFFMILYYIEQKRQLLQGLNSSPNLGPEDPLECPLKSNLKPLVNRYNLQIPYLLQGDHHPTFRIMFSIKRGRNVIYLP
ncbi:hypothetical protein GE061_014100 [Apolygus lucorum]|uniref:Uncharacterized protein n=1 Tax=Apolygus lucorum TaxID=248454 RepID=A0A8S9XPX1_APOLU|nr:hypothetical protein GE061_014100 [Apolygus lucorum]